MIINYGKHTIDQNDVSEIKKVLVNQLLTQGKYNSYFEKKLRTKFGSKYCSVVSSGTAALHLALMALSLPKNSKVATIPLTFVATSNSILMNNLIPEFVDIDSISYTIDLNKLEDKLKKDKKIKAVISVDYAGNLCDWKSLSFLAKKYNLKLINDNCHAIGSKYNNDSKYACKYADLVTQSYHPVKAITTAEGGSVLTNNKSLHEKIQIYKNHGIMRNKELSRKYGLWFYSIKALGYNYRLSDIQCALGVSQLSKLDFFVKKRQEIAKIYDKAFANFENLRIPPIRKNCDHSYHLYPLQINFKKIKVNKKNFFLKLLKKKILPQVHYIPIHYHQFYKKKFNFKKGDFAISEDHFNKEVSLPIYPLLKKKYVLKIIKNIFDILK